MTIFTAYMNGNTFLLDEVDTVQYFTLNGIVFFRTR